jgi:hypothetical protein
MTTVHAQILGDKAVLPRAELERLLELARQSEQVELQTQDDDSLNAGILWLAKKSGTFDWLAEEEEIYSINDLKVRYR